MSVFKQGYMLVIASLLTAQVLVFIGIGLEILVLYGPLALIVIIAVLAAFFLALVGIVGLPFLLAKIALWPTKWPTHDEPSLRRGTATVSTNTGQRTQALPLLHERWLLPLTVSRALAYVVMVTVILVMGFLLFRHARPSTITDTQIYTTFSAEAVFFAALFAYMLINRRRAASRST